MSNDSITSMFKFFVKVLFLILIISNTQAKEIFKYPLPDILNYPPSVNGGYAANWGIAQGKDGKLYFANEYGVLIYDGKTWSSTILDNKDSARSIATDIDGNVIVGSRGNIGFLSNDGSGVPIYKSLNEFIEDKNYKNRDIFYETFSLNNGEIFFRSLNNLFFYKNKNIRIIKRINKKKFGVSRVLNNKIYVAISGLGLATIENYKPSLIKNSEIFKNKIVTGFHLSEKNELIIFTRNNGVFKSTNETFLKIDHKIIDKIRTIYRSFSIGNEKIALATYEGVYFLDHELNVLSHYNSDTGLRVDNVRSVFQDRSGIIWVALSDGISKINENSNFKFYPLKSSRLESKAKVVSIFNDHLYVGTNMSLKKLQLDENNELREQFVKIGKDQLNTQVWEVLKFEDKLLIGSNYGFGIIDAKDNYKEVLSNKIIGRVYEIFESKIFPNHLILRSKKGIFLINKNNLKDYKIIFKGSGAGYLKELEKKSEIWFRVSRKGIHRYKFNSNDVNILDDVNKTIYKDKKIIDGKAKIFKIDDKLIFKSKNGIFEFDYLNESFFESNFFSKIPNIKNKTILKLKKSNKNTYWINFTERVKGKRIQEFYEIKSNDTIVRLPFDYISDHLGIEFYFFENLNIMTSNEGIVIINNNNRIKSTPGNIIFSKIENNDNYIHLGAPSKDLINNNFKIKNDFKFSENRFSFSISLTDYFYENKNKYRYKLDGFDKNYTDFSKSENITYTNLKPGNYIFKIQGMNSDGLVSDVKNYHFKVNNPWWQSKIFYIVEFIFFSILLITTLFLKQTGKAAALATSISFMMILAFFEYINFVLDPIILDLSNGVPVFSIFSKVLLGLILLPLERLINSILDKMAKRIKVN